MGNSARWFQAASGYFLPAHGLPASRRGHGQAFQAALYSAPALRQPEKHNGMAKLKQPRLKQPRLKQPRPNAGANAEAA